MDAILIAGPTASGKSKLAVELALKHDGEIVNTDSMQIYPVLDVLSARPATDDLDAVPHHLYGYAPVEKPWSVAKWQADAARVAQDIWARGKVPVFVGGTGLYFRALEQGLSQTPEIPMEIRAKVRQALVEQGSEAVHDWLAQHDGEAAARLKPGDSHRIGRALEVVLATGKTLSHFHGLEEDDALLVNKTCMRILRMPERAILHERINARTHLMMEQGAISEVESLLNLNLSVEATVLRAIGVPQITDFLQGRIDRATMIERIQAATRQYAKRQSTWFRGQFGGQWAIKA